MDALSAVAAQTVRSPPRLKVFISYSRDDLKFADQLDVGLRLCGFQPMLDRHGISGGEDWRRRLGSLIRDADTVVFVLSPASASSEICQWEVDEALRLNKRILPAIIRPLEDVTPPPLLQERNYLFFYDEESVPGSGFGTGLAQLVAALQTDLAWIREHTRLLARATEWEMGGRPINRLLSGPDIADAKDWAARRSKDAPAPTNLHLDFIKASEQQEIARSSAERQQLEMMVRVQEERAKALAAAEEALARAADVQAKRARLRNGAIAAIALFAVIAGVQWWRAYAKGQEEKAQRRVAEYQRTVAERQTAEAETHKRLAQRQTAIAKEQKALADGLRSRAQEMLEASTDLIVNLSKKFKFDAADYANVRHVFEKGAEEDSMSMTNLGLLYQNGWGVEQDYAKARQWYEKSAAKDNAFGMNRLAALYMEGRGVAKDYEKARQWYEKAAAKNNASAMNELGILHHNGQGTSKDFVKAREWYEKAAALGNVNAFANLGILLDNGDGVAQDYAKARSWYEKAAAGGDAAAMNNLGALYDDGRGVPQDYAKGREWYEKAAANGSAVAMKNLGEIYAAGRGVTRDFAKAREWYEKAAARGNAVATVHLRTLPVEEAEATGRYAEAYKLRVSLAEETEKDETQRAGSPGRETAGKLMNVAWDALLARDFSTALSVSERAHKLAPDYLAIETNWAHALMFLGRREEARALYLRYKGKPTTIGRGKLWEIVVAEDFAEFRKAGLTHPMMAEIEKQLSAVR